VLRKSPVDDLNPALVTILRAADHEGRIPVCNDIERFGTLMRLLIGDGYVYRTPNNEYYLSETGMKAKKRLF